MRSKAHFKTHPIHPMLVVFPIAFFPVTIVVDILSLVITNEMFPQLGFYLCAAGIIGGLCAAVPGFIDYTYTIPPNSSAQVRATKHMILNISMLCIFGIALMLRRNDEIPFL